MSLRDEALGFLKSAVRQNLNSGTRITSDPLSMLRGGLEFSDRLRSSSSNVLNAMQSRPDPLTSFNWQCSLPDIEGERLGWEYVEEATLPFVDFDSTSNYRAGKMYHYPHHYSLGTLSLKLYEDTSGKTSNYVNRWKSLIIDSSTGLYNTPSFFKKPITITIFDSRFTTVMFVTYIGCWIQRMDSFQLGGESNRINPQVEYNVDDIEISFGKFGDGEIPSIIDTIGREFPSRITQLPDLFPNNFLKFDVKSFF